MTATASPTSGAILRRDLLWTPLREQRRRLGAIVLSLAGLAAAQSLMLLMISRFAKALFQSDHRSSVPVSELTSPRLLEYLPPRYAAMSVSVADLAQVVPVTLLVAGLCWAAATYLFQLNQQAVSLYVAKRYRERLFAALISLPYLEIRRRPAGEWMSLVMNDVMFLQGRLSDIMIGLVRDTVVIVAAFFVLAWLHWPSALVLASAAPFAAYGMGRTGKRIAKYSEAFQRELARLSGAVLDLRSRFDLIRSARAEERELHRFAAINLRYYHMIRRSILVRSAFAPMLETVGICVFALAIYAVGRGLWGDFTPDMLLLFFAALGLLLKPLRECGEQLTRLGETRGALRDSLATFERMREHAAATVAPATGHEVLPPAAGASALHIADVAIALGDQVRFAGQDLRLATGRSIAIVGPSGAGKSTLLMALAGLAPPQRWQADASWPAATRRCSMVSQTPFLFDDTIGANLTYGLSDGELPGDEALWRALALVNVDKEIAALPERLGTRMRAIGGNVSGGQLQRLVIARALLRRQPFLLLDEATSAVDVKSEKDITERLIASCRSGAVGLVAVTHRLTWLGLYDEVWFIEGGRRVFVGPHARLLEEPRYRDFCAAAGGDDGVAPV